MNRTFWNAEVETLAPQALRDLQLRRLRKQLAYNWSHSLLYRAKFEQAGLKPEDVRTLEDLRHLPPTGKDEQRRTQEESLAELGHPYGPGTITCAPPEKFVRINSTSGTTGMPTLYALTAHDVAIVSEMHSRKLWMVGIRPGHRILQALSLSMFTGGLPLSQGIMNMGACAIPVGVEGGTKRVLDFIQLTAPDALFTTPSFAQYLMEQAPKLTGKDPRRFGIRWIFPVGEPGAGNVELRKLLSEGFGGAQICDNTGGGHPYQAAECVEPAGVYGGMHFISGDHCILELMDPATKEPVALEEGAIGEMLLTFLDWEGTPFQRYAYGDLLQVFTEPCHCGRSGLRLKIIGRADDMLIVKGMNVFPEAIKQEILKFAPRVTGFFRILLDKPGHQVAPPLRIRLEHAEGLEGEALAALEAEMLKGFREGLRVAPKFLWVAPGTLPREMKKTKLIEIEPNDG